MKREMRFAIGIRSCPKAGFLSKNLPKRANGVGAEQEGIFACSDVELYLLHP